MPTISPKDVKKIAVLARLGLSDQEIAQAALDLEQVLAHFAVIQKIDTKAVATSDDVTGKRNISREDQVQTDVLCNTDLLIKLAPDQEARQFKVKAVFAS